MQLHKESKFVVLERDGNNPHLMPVLLSVDYWS